MSIKVKNPRAAIATPRVQIGKLESMATLWLAEEDVKKDLVLGRPGLGTA